jgi:hypothetical protein
MYVCMYLYVYVCIFFVNPLCNAVALDQNCSQKHIRKHMHTDQKLTWSPLWQLASALTTLAIVPANQYVRVVYTYSCVCKVVRGKLKGKG